MEVPVGAACKDFLSARGSLGLLVLEITVLLRYTQLGSVQLVMQQQVPAWDEEEQIPYKYKPFFLILIVGFGAGERAQWALIALPKVLSSHPSNHMVAHNHL